MGMYADDLKEDYSHELQDVQPHVSIHIECEFEVSIIHRKTGVCEWSGTVLAGSKKGAQSAFRKKYAHIRDQYTHAYGLGIRALQIKTFVI